MKWRHYTVVVLFLGATVWLGWHVVSLSFALSYSEPDFLRKKGDDLSVREEQISAQRGVIHDRWGEPLAVSTPVYNVFVDPGLKVPPEERWEQLAGLVGLSVADLSARFADRKRRYVLLKRRASWDEMQMLQAAKIEGVKFTTVYRRYYPAGEVAAHVVGVAGFVEEASEEIGREGVESSFDDHLRATPGKKLVLRNARHQNVRELQYLAAPREGKDLTLSIDLRLQYIAYRELKAAVEGHGATAGTAVMLDVRTGDILAMVNQPSYNPNGGIPPGAEGVRNIAVTDRIEPGSTAKAFTAIAGLESGRYTPDSMFHTAPGYITVRGKTVKDARNYGDLTLRGVLAKSSQVGIVKLALDLERDAVYRTLTRAGVGQPVGSGLPREYSGLISASGLRSDLVRINLAYGYAFNVSALQLARAYLTLARSGNKPPVSIIKSEGPASGEQVFDPVHARTVLEMLESVTEAGGTAHSAAVPGYRIAGKTGTARVLTASENGGKKQYDDRKHVALFAGVAPLSDPQLVTVVVIWHPSRGLTGGGAVAAPVFARIAEKSLRLLGVPGDAPPPMTANRAAPAAGRSST